MKIGIISDTHINQNLDKLNNFLDKHMKDMDMIIHGGDYKSSEVVNTLKEFKKFLGVWGNVDNNHIREALPKREIIEIENYKIGIFHGHGTKKTTIDRAYDEFKNNNVDIIILGHSHQPIVKTKNNVLLLNPGSPTSKRKERWFSFIILELEDNNISVNLKFFK